MVKLLAVLCANVFFNNTFAPGSRRLNISMKIPHAAMALILAMVLSACGASDGRQRGSDPLLTELAKPNIVMEADPVPPFTYWAPEGATIRNHPRQVGVWVAQGAGQPDRYYFGDQCGASGYQQFVGRSLAEMPSAPTGAVWRTHCSACAVTQDLAMARLNISFDERTQTIDRIACG
ncbi:hypothetical protein NDN01_25760 [Sphingomonas sp. QA11]|uniref:hypothetical protein n=1 Tax=Sphingomonas sp. QA11 TaxID=2950605 RepID=UPI002349D904|nr:hypothetical protein [Sphingomonas sp. QA11]WCM27347.1 hypothetical protein NDN01_25760 [Sphingomonas sp. QA11]